MKEKRKNYREKRKGQIEEGEEEEIKRIHGK